MDPGEYVVTLTASGKSETRTVSVQGSIDREAVARVVNAHLQEVRGCYESALLKANSLAGKSCT